MLPGGSQTGYLRIILLWHPLQGSAENWADLQGRVRKIPVAWVAGREWTSLGDTQPRAQCGQQSGPGAPHTNLHPKKQRLRRCGLCGAVGFGWKPVPCLSSLQFLGENECKPIQ